MICHLTLPCSICVKVIAQTTSNVILKEDMSAAKTWSDVFRAIRKFAIIQFRANCYIAASWGLSLWNTLDFFIKSFNFSLAAA